tara:strand:+ start:5534 stop:6136 length:603 start_codon:yes stop_codon:yes gene_type:complete
MRLSFFLLFISLPILSDSLCEYHSIEEEVSKVQTVGEDLPDIESVVSVTSYEERLEFEGLPGEPAYHEGIDYIHENESVSDIPILSAFDGEVVYVRSGCPETGQFERNEAQRECGAGWGNHIVIKHENFFTRYAHLRANSIAVGIGEKVKSADLIGLMGNSGRSNKRHLHFEVGVYDGDFKSCKSSQSFDYVVDPLKLGF